MDKSYDHKSLEPKIYNMWEKLGVFSPEKSTETRKKEGLEAKKETFCVLMPPPNANAPLHCGHATYSIQDLMARYKRMQGYKTLYFPGTDHAAFETQVVYERNLKKEGKSRFDFDRQALYSDILNFVKKNSGIAIDQMRRLGMSADWDRNVFMLDDFVIKTVYDTFIKMHKEGLIYRDAYLVNYSPTHGTTFSNLETEHVETKSPLYYVRYRLKDEDNFITVATVRPETIYADTAIAVNPKDTRYKKLVGKFCINPLNNREMEIISDPYVDKDFGTGALKITPGHDFNDYAIGLEHKLEMISVIDLDGKMTKDAGEVAGLKVVPAREKVAEILKERGLLEGVDTEYTNNLLVDYKDHKPIEPMLLPNWFVKMDSLAKKAKKAVEKNEVRFNKPTWKKQILDWLGNTRDWPVSRQTVFGIRIPVWYKINDKSDLHVVFINKEGKMVDDDILTILGKYTIGDVKAGLQKVIASKDAEYIISVDDPGEKYIPETDTFDTWFSSGQWPLTTLKYPDGLDFKEFFPTSFLDTMWDILFFWVARMIMFSLYLTDKVPFKMVYIHGRVDDEFGRKMSKSLGNVINPIDFVDKYGADALRMGLLVGSNTGAKTLPLGEGKVRGYRNFANKIWNIGRFIKLMVEEKGKITFLDDDIKKKLSQNDKDILSKLNTLISETTKNIDKLRFMDAGEGVYQFVWHELADKYVEYVKTLEGSDEKVTSLSVLHHTFLTCLKLLHPFMPFVTEAVWEQMPKKKEGILALSSWPTSL